VRPRSFDPFIGTPQQHPGEIGASTSKAFDIEGGPSIGITDPKSSRE
jgi:hypothetical protein